MRYIDPIEEAYSIALQSARKDYEKAVATITEAYKKMKAERYKATLCKKEDK